MTSQIDSLLLIDGCAQTNHANEEIIRSTNLVRNVNVYNSAKSAISFINTEVSEGKSLPNIIFVGTKLQKMSSWDFLEILSSQAIDLSKNEIYIINSGTNTTDLIRNSLHPLTQRIINTPLIGWEIKGLLNKYVNRWKIGVA